MASKGRPYRTVTVEGFEVLIGRGDEENDALTFEVAAPDDLWLHVAGGIAGSHVVIRNPEQLTELPAPVVTRAAELAAWHSKARARRQVEVHVARVAHGRKPPAVPPGKVELARLRRVPVRPAPRYTLR